MTVIALRPRAPSRQAEPEQEPHPTLRGTFRSPTGDRGEFVGSLRLRRLLITPHGAFVSGVVTGELSASDGTSVGRDSRPITTAADITRVDGCTRVVARAFDVDMMGIPVSVTSFVLDPLLEVSRSRPIGSARHRSAARP